MKDAFALRGKSRLPPTAAWSPSFSSAGQPVTVTASCRLGVPAYGCSPRPGRPRRGGACSARPRTAAWAQRHPCPWAHRGGSGRGVSGGTAVGTARQGQDGEGAQAQGGVVKAHAIPQSGCGMDGLTRPALRAAVMRRSGARGFAEVSGRGGAGRPPGWGASGRPDRSCGCTRRCPGRSPSSRGRPGSAAIPSRRAG